MENKVSKISNIIAPITGLAPKSVSYAPTSPNYPLYLKENSVSQEELVFERENPLPASPLVSVFLAEEAPSETAVSETVLSLTSQTYGTWELILAVGLGFPAHDKFGKLDNVKTILSDGSTKKLLLSARELVRGDYVMLLKAGDRLSPDALYRMVGLAVTGKHDLVYADNDYHDEFGKRVCPIFKPCFSPVTELCIDYVSRPLLVLSELDRVVGGCNDVTNDEYHKYVMRCMDHAKRAASISRILCSCVYKGIEPFREFFRINSELMTCAGKLDGSMRIAASKHIHRSVSIIIAGATDAQMLKTCLEAIDAKATYFEYRIIVSVSREICEPLKKYVEALKRNKAADVVLSDSSSVPALINTGAAASLSEYLVFVSPDSVVLSPDFIESLIEPLLLKRVCITGGKLLDKNGLLLNSGSVLGMAGTMSSPYIGTFDEISDMKKGFYTALQRNVTAVSGALMAISSEDFEKLGMLDETFSDFGWDTELCIRAIERGLQCVYTPYASAKLLVKPKELYKTPEKNIERCMDAFGEYIKKGDPYFSPNYDRRFTHPQLAIQPEID